MMNKRKRMCIIGVLVIVMVCFAACGKKTGNNTVNIDNKGDKNTAEVSDNEKQEIDYEIVDADMVAFKGRSGIYVSSYVAIKNNSSCPITYSGVNIDYEDDDGNLLATDSMTKCIPEAVKSGQTGYIYSYYYDISGIDISDGLMIDLSGQVKAVSDFFEIEISDISAKTGGFQDITITARGRNNTGEQKNLVEPGGIFFGKDGKAVGFCYGMESFEAGQTKSFEISGDLMSSDYDTSMVDHVEVFAQGYSWY